MKDPKWGESIDTYDFPSVFNIKSGFGPNVDGKRSWNRCWSHIPKLWEVPVRNMLNKISAKYVLERTTDPEDGEYDVIIDQIKDKYGTLRVYFNAKTNEIYNDVEQMINECEEELKIIDPFYGEPW